MICMLISKLPGGLMDRWNRKVQNIRRSQLREPTLQDLIKFVEEETILMNDPLFSREAISEYVQKTDKMHPRRQRLKTCYTRSDSREKKDDIKQLKSPSSDSSKLSAKCKFCDGDHDLDDCQFYNEIAVEDRSSFLKKNKLCYGCYSEITPNHTARTCKKRRICKICQGKHPSGLHGYKAKVKTQPTEDQEGDSKIDVKSNCAGIKNAAVAVGEVISMCVVPVRVKHHNSKNEVTTFALLDSCSQGTFATDDLLQRLNISGVETSISIKTLNGNQNVKSQLTDGLLVSKQTVSKNDKVQWLKLPKVFSRKEIPVDQAEIATPEKLTKWKYLNCVAEKIASDDSISVDLLIGANCTEALEPVSVISSQDGGPYALETALGWCVVGPIEDNGKGKKVINCNRIAVEDIGTKKVAAQHFQIESQVKDTGISDMLERMYHLDFTEPKFNSNMMLKKLDEVSHEDKQFLKLMDTKATKFGDHHQLPLPLKDPSVQLPNNRLMAERRAECLKKRFKGDDTHYQKYKEFMDEIIMKGYAVVSKSKPENGRVWYLPHHGVYHPRKPNKIRVVFDCSAEYAGRSINKELMSGPDLTNQIIGTLIKFRQGKIAFVGDIEKMFFQVLVSNEHRNLLRFLWWKDSNLSNELIDHEMCVHLFGGTSSPSCSNYALRKTSIEGENQYGKEAAEVLQENFYVDDMLKSVDEEDHAIQLVKNVKDLCASGGFHLTKFLSNSKKVLQSISENDRRKGVKDVDLTGDLPSERTLGVLWNADTDQFGFKVSLSKKPMTRRGILSTISSIYDPLGFAAPFLLHGKLLNQQLCKENLGWDEIIPTQMQIKWKKWESTLPLLENLTINRCYKPAEFGEVVESSIHHFADACDYGYGQSSYLRLVDKSGRIHCSLVIGKARVAPIKYMTIPRMELVAATLSVKMSILLKRELQLKCQREVFWTDSEVILGYIRNESRRFKIFVANRIEFIKEHSDVNQWYYVYTKENPADYASRGIDMNNSKKVEKWIQGPKFLWETEDKWFKEKEVPSLNPEDPELKKCVSVHQVAVTLDILSILEGRVSQWNKLLRVVALVLLFVTKLKTKTTSIGEKQITKEESTLINTTMIEEAKISVIKLVQQKYFQKEINLIQGLQSRSSKEVKLKIQNLDPFVDKDGIIRVGGRLKHSYLNNDCKHPVLLPKESTVSNLIIQHYHQIVAHGGRGLTLNEVRSAGYWIIGANSAVKKMVYNCVECRKLRGKIGEQMMANLPLCRVNDAAPFTYCGVDMFGPFLIKQRRSILKRYGAMFTCMACRAVHIEVTHSLNTDSFILALRRLIGRRGKIRSIYSDNGGNFIGADRELKRAFMEMDDKKISSFLQKQGCDWIKWHNNPPFASHMGGVWERQIRSARAILTSLVKTHGQSLDDESLGTLITEVEGILNSRPLTVDTLSDPASYKPLSPMNILTMKSKVVAPPPGIFQQSDVYCRKRWRRVQHIANEFWARWKKEYLQSLQERQKWDTRRINFDVDDIVLVKQIDTARNQWPMAKVIKVNKGEDGLVRSVCLRFGDRNGNDNSKHELERPIDKCVLLLKGKDV